MRLRCKSMEWYIMRLAGLTWPDTGGLNKFQIQTTLKHSNTNLLKGFTLKFVICL